MSILGVEVEPFKIANAAGDEASHLSTKPDAGTSISAASVPSMVPSPRNYRDHSRHDNKFPYARPVFPVTTAVEWHTIKSQQNRGWITSKSSDPSCHQVDVAKKHRILAVERLHGLKTPLEHCERVFFRPQHDSLVCHGQADLEFANHLRDVLGLGDMRIHSWVNERCGGQYGA